MAKRVKALNERREQLKAGIVASTSKRRKKITNKNEAADRVRTLLGSLKMLQDEQVQKAQIKLMQAGIRSKDRSEEHTSELQSLMRISYAVFCLKKKR